MKSDLSFSEKISYLLGDFPTIPPEKSEIPTMVFLEPEPSSTISATPSHYTSFLYNQSSQSNEHPLNMARVSTVVPSSINPFSMIPSPSYKDANNNRSQSNFFNDQIPMTFTPNNNQMEFMHERLNTGKGIWDFSQQNLFQYNETSQSQVTPSLSTSVVYERLNTDKGIWDFSQQNIFPYGETSQSQVNPSLSTSVVYDENPSLLVKPRLQANLSCVVGFVNKPQHNDEGLIPSEQKRQKRVDKTIEIQQRDFNTIKRLWTSDEDRYIKSFKVFTFSAIQYFHGFSLASLYTLLVRVMFKIFVFQFDSFYLDFVVFIC